MRSIRRLLAATTLTFVAGCQLLSGVSDLVVDPPSAVDAGDDAVVDAAPDSEGGEGGGAVEVLSIEIRLVGGGALESVIVGGAEVADGGAGKAACAGAACKGKIEVDVPRGAPVAVVARGQGIATDAHFLAPSSCKKTGTACVLPAVTGPIAVTVQAVAANYVFVTSETFTGNLGGVAGGDVRCQAAASNAGLPGNYRAWLSTNGSPAPDHLGGSAVRGFVRVDGVPFADTMKNTAEIDLVEGRVFSAIVVDEHGVALGAAAKNDVVFTGTIARGLWGGADCDAWTSSLSSKFGGEGSPFAGGVAWTNDGPISPCDRRGHLYCFRVDRNVTITPPPRPTPSRVAFMSEGALVFAGGGIGDADAVCAAEATSAGLPGTFKAYLATTVEPAHARFDRSVAKGGWYRRDGVAIFPEPIDLSSPDLVTRGPLTQFASGQYLDDDPSVDVDVWTGMDDNPKLVSKTQGSSCANWTTAAGTGAFGRAPYVDGRFTFAFTNITCNAGRHLYCLEE